MCSMCSMCSNLFSEQAIYTKHHPIIFVQDSRTMSAVAATSSPSIMAEHLLRQGFGGQGRSALAGGTVPADARQRVPPPRTAISAA